MSSTAESSKQPYFVIGAGDLIFHVHRQQPVLGSGNYDFNLFRIEATGEATSWLRPEDLRDIVKGCQILAFSIADDGWIDHSLRGQLFELAGQLQNITDSWSQQDAEI